jgi:hypothetical protein
VDLGFGLRHPRALLSVPLLPTHGFVPAPVRSALAALQHHRDLAVPDGDPEDTELGEKFDYIIVSQIFDIVDTKRLWIVSVRTAHPVLES